MKKNYSVVFSFFFFVTYIFSTPSQERLFIRNNSRNTLIVSYEFFCNDTDFFCEYRYDYSDMHWRQKIYDIDVEITNLREMSFGVKMRAIFKDFSIRTEDGTYIIKDIEDLCNANIKEEDRYFLEIYDM